MPGYKWCICDMDGTLLNSNDIITEENLQALKKLQQNGIEVMLASGRLDLMVKRYIRQLDLTGHVISCNGGLIRNIRTGEIVYSSAMDRDIVQEILTYSMNNKVNFLIYTSNIMFTNNKNPRAIKYEKINMEVSENLRFEIRYLEDDSMKALDGFDIIKILLIFEQQEQVSYHMDKFKIYDKLELVSSAEGLLDIMAFGTSKGRALQILSEKLKVDPEEVIAFGDNYNDIDMLEFAGMPIAMENSVEELKIKAKYITKSNDESGVAFAINHYLLEKSV